MNRAFNVFLSTLLGLCLATGAVAQTGDRLKTPVKVGNGTASEKKMIFDIGSGASNPVIRSTAGGTLQFSNNGVDFSAFGSGAGFGINYMSANQDFELNANGYSAYQDAAGPAPVDATGGSPTLTITRTTVSGEIVRGTASGKITKDAVNRQGEGISYALTIDNADKAKPVAIRFNYKAGTGYNSCDIKVYVVETTGPNVIPVNNGGCLPQGEGEFATTVLLKTTASYRLALHVATTSATAYTMFVDNFRFGPGDVTQGSAVGFVSSSSAPFTIGVQSGTPPTPGTGAIYYTRVERVGAYAVIRYEFQQTTNDGNPGSPGSVYTIPMPSGLTIDTSKLAQTGSQESTRSVGYGEISNNIATPYVYDSDSISVMLETGSQWGHNFIALNDPVYLSLTVRVPIAEWSDNVFVENTTVEYAYNSDVSDASDLTSFAYGESGTQFGNFTAARDKRVRFKTPIGKSDYLQLQISQDGGITWTPFGVNPNVGIYQNRNGTLSGVALTPVNSTDVDVAFQAYRSTGGGAFGAAGDGWGDIDNDPNWLWRLVKSSNPLTLGHDLVDQNKSGLVKSAGQLKGTNTNDNAAAGYVGEYVESVVLSSAPVATPSATITDITFISLTSGDWDVCGHVFWGSPGSAIAELRMAVSTTSGAFEGDLAINSTWNTSDVPITGTGVTQDYCKRVLVSSTTNVYLVARPVWSGAYVEAFGKISARRMR